MTFHEHDPNRRIDDPYVRQPVPEGRSNAGWMVPLALVAILAIGGLMMYSASDNTTTTARNDAPVSRQTTPTTPSAVPAPAPTPPAKTQ
jgi:hypothetical protein